MLDNTNLVNEFWRQRGKNKARIKEVFDQVGLDYRTREVAIVNVYDAPGLQGDVHAFIRLVAEPKKVVHVQGYPGFSTEEQMNLMARVMDYDRMIAVRGTRPSIGNEHEGIASQLLNQQFISYKAQDLEKLLGEKISQLKL